MRDEEIKLMEVWGFYAQLLDYAYHRFYSVNNLWVMYLIKVTEYYTFLKCIFIVYNKIVCSEITSVSPHPFTSDHETSSLSVYSVIKQY